MQNEKSSPARSRVVFLLVLGVGVTLLALWVIQGFLIALVIAAVLAALANPAYRRLVSLFHGRERVAAVLTVLLALLLVIVPVLAFLLVLVGDAVQIAERVGPWVAQQVSEDGEWRRAFEESPTFHRLLPYQDQILEQAGKVTGKVASFVAQAVAVGAAAAARFVLMLVVALYAMFVFLRHGRAILDWGFELTPLSADDRERLVETFTGVTRATLGSSVVVGVVQGGLVGVAFAVAGLDGPFFWGALAALASVVPMIGAAVVWGPAVVYLALTGRPGAAIALLVWGAVLVGTIDNFLRPWLLGKATKVPDLAVLVTILGGLALFGAAGLVVGPIVCALFFTVWDLWSFAVKEAD